MAWETQGPISDRTRERLATSDKGVVLLRQVLREQIERVQRGEDPIGVVRDPDHATIDTNLSEALAQMAGRTHQYKGD
jgi:5,5'-dehydrodivanillate O-demethylase